MLSLIFDLAVATGAILVMLAAGIAEWRRGPYTREDFTEAMERICDGVEELWRVQDEAMFDRTTQAGWEAPARQNDAVRRLCQGMLRDMLRNTVYILNRAEPCCGEVRRRLERAEINRRAAEVVRQGTRLVFRLRWAQWRLALQPDTSAICALTLKAAGKYACLWSEVVRFLEAKFASAGAESPVIRQGMLSRP